MISNILMISGSYRADKTTSMAILNYLAEHIHIEGCIISCVKVSSKFPDKKTDREISSKMDEADLIIFCSPKYNLGLPAPVIHLFQYLQERKNLLQKKTRKFISIIQFEAPVGGDIAQNMCHHFSDAMDFQWFGGLTLPGAGEIKGESLEKTGSMMKNIRKALIITAEAISRDKPVPEKARKRGMKQLPTWMIIPIVNSLIRQFVKKNNINLLQKPYENNMGLWS